ncbi:Hpt domain-containing protein [Arthrobacter sp. KK5.5]|uniref:Hpt domain-containing protein n=1 Tax=Arthrobacter sp. KK5.5 TaxID=3373084 RepID=UPI003EE6200D
MGFEARGQDPLVDRSVLNELREQMDDPDVARGFVRDFVALWPERYSKLCDAVGRADYDSLHDAVLSLKVASIMVGAVRLGNLAIELETAIGGAWPVGLDKALVVVRICGEQTVAELDKAA